MDMGKNKIQDLVKVGRQIISMILLEIAMNVPKKRAILPAPTPTAELAEEASLAAVVLTVRLLPVSAAILPTSLSGAGSRPTLYLIP